MSAISSASSPLYPQPLPQLEVSTPAVHKQEKEPPLLKDLMYIVGAYLPTQDALQFTQAFPSLPFEGVFTGRQKELDSYFSWEMRRRIRLAREDAIELPPDLQQVGEKISSLDLRLIGTTISAKQLASVIKYCPHLTEMLFDHLEVNGEDLMPLATLKKLTKLSLKECQISKAAELFANLPSLTSVDLEDSEVQEEDLLALPLETLKEFVMCENITPDTSETVVERARQLHTLKRMANLTDAMILKLAPSITDLGIYDPDTLTDAGIRAGLARLPNLVGATFEDLDFLTDTTLLQLPLESLFSLDINGCRAVTAAGLSAAFVRMAKMRDLDLHNTAVTDAHLSQIPAASLTRLMISECPRLTDAGIRAAIVHMIQLREVSFAGTAITDATLQAVPAEHMESLLLRKCSQLTPAGIGTAVAAMPKLKEVVLDDTDYSDETLRKLPRDSMQLLNLGNCRKITYEGLDEVLPQMPLLEYVDIAHFSFSGVDGERLRAKLPHVWVFAGYTVEY